MTGIGTACERPFGDAGACHDRFRSAGLGCSPAACSRARRRHAPRPAPDGNQNSRWRRDLRLAVRGLHFRYSGRCSRSVAPHTRVWVPLAPSCAGVASACTSSKRGSDTSTMEGRAMFGIRPVLAGLQRELIVANTNDRLACARPRGRVGGRPPKLTEDQAAHAHQPYAAREKTVPQIADIFGVPTSTVYGPSTRPRPCPSNRRRPRSRSPEDCRWDTCSLVSCGTVSDRCAIPWRVRTCRPPPTAPVSGTSSTPG